MVKITRITTQKNNNERFSIFIEKGVGEEFAFGVDIDVMINYGLHKGVELDDEMLEGIQFEDQVKKGMNFALNYLSYRMRSEKEVNDYLLKKEMPEEAIPSIFEKLKRYGYLNDLEFAKAFVRTKINAGGKGPFVIGQELKQKGVNKNMADKALEEYSYEQQLEHARTAAEKKANKLKKASSTELRQKVNQELRAKGFDRDIIQEVMQEIELEKSADEEWEALVLQAQKAERRYSNLDRREFDHKMKQFLYRKGFPFPLINRYLEQLNDQ
ncbi:recombination regulator RecX [Pseudalkalibacillus hwajinpoensis]|uniref:recombination regulator RecX n=1 Tax=Guptibacillus hwajinpoensis TaxID=208199 RepID=UPI00325B41B1